MLELLTQVAGNATLQLIVALALMAWVIPNKCLTKIPVIGDMLQMALQLWAAKRVKDLQAEHTLLTSLAETEVRSMQQLKSAGTLDSATARTQAVSALIDAGSIPAVAGRYIEAAVNSLNGKSA